MKKHIENIQIFSGVIILMFTFNEIIDIAWGGGFYGNWYNWFITLGVVLFVGGLLGKIEKINKKIDSINKD